MLFLLYRSVNNQGERIFKVQFEGGVLTFDSIDLYGRSGGKFTAFTLDFALAVSDGELNIEFSPTVENAQICGIEIRTPVVRTFPFLISAGPAYTQTTTLPATTFDDFGTFMSDAYVDTWVADAPYVTGGTVSSGIDPGVDILNTAEDGLYRKERYGVMAYKIPIVNGNYQITLHFAELS
jgi:Malectin domain